MTEFAIVLPILVVRNSSDRPGNCPSQVRSSTNDLDQSKLTVTCASSWEIGSGVGVDVDTRPRSTSLDPCSRPERSRPS